MAASDFQVAGTNTKALFTLKLHRGDGMCLLAMNWKKGKPPDDFVGFAIESKPPDGVHVVGTHEPGADQTHANTFASHRRII